MPVTSAFQQRSWLAARASSLNRGSPACCPGMTINTVASGSSAGKTAWTKTEILEGTLKAFSAPMQRRGFVRAVFVLDSATADFETSFSI